MPPAENPEDSQKLERLREAMYSRTLSEQMKARERRNLEPPQHIVGDDFIHDSDPLPKATVAPRGIGTVRRALWWILGAAVLFFICAVGFFAYYFAFGGGALSSSPQNIDIAVSGPPEIQSGGVTELQVVVTNRNTVPLDLSALIVTFPQGTRSVADLSQDEPTLEQDLGTIAPGASVQGEIPAVFSGVAGQQSDVKFQLQYHLPGSNSIFTASSDYTLTFGSSPVSVSVDGNSQTVSGQPVQFTINVASNATQPIQGALLSIAYPFGFTLSSATPPQTAPGVWNLGTLNPGQTHSVTVQGTLTGSPGDTRTFNIVAGTGQAATSTSVTTQLSSESYAMDITSSFLGLSIFVNGASSSATVSPGESVSVSINYVNNLGTAINNAVIVAKLSGAQIDGSTVRSSNGFYRSTDSSMYWDQSTTNGLFSSIPAGSSGTLKFTFTAPTTAMLASTTNPHIVMSLSAAGNRTDQSGAVQNLQGTAQQTIGIASGLQFAAQGLYYSDPFGSSGPMPPKAGTETTYGIEFTVTNTTDQIQDAKITAFLPPYVRWLGTYGPPGENISGNPNNGEIIWDLGTIAPDTGVNGSPPRRAAIAIGFTPSTSQIGSQPALIQNIALSGTEIGVTVPVSGGPFGATSTGAVLIPTSDITTNLSQISESGASMNIVPDPGFTPANATVVAK
ncbi:MAG TPA: hypothetical protein VG102_00225 [Candidatus Paceibacterota bacterium]|jgi:hypothetical protein|nr:hypothetical protein [Candidatus Paceibacterota bacterium]